VSDEKDAPEDTLRGRAAGSRTKLWLLLEADRWLVTAVLLTAVFVFLVSWGYLYPGAETALRDTDSVDTVFQALLTATITGVTLVLTLNQLVLSQEFGSVNDQRERMEGAVQFRHDVADAVGISVSPSRPAQFLRLLVEMAGDTADRLRDEASGSGNGSLEDEVDQYTRSLAENASRVSDGLDGGNFGDFDVISSALNFNYSGKMFEGRRIKEEYADHLTEDADEEIEHLIQLLQMFGLAREHFKTLYFQWDLINLSRRILVVSVPALLVSTGMALFVDVEGYGWSLYGTDTLVLFVAAAVTVSLLPFVILLVYVIRIATVTRHTLSIGPFILRETDEATEVDWDD
jgi:hypothetical protein